MTPPRPAVWAVRIALGSVFVVSGIAKAIDPYGSAFKFEDYLAAWHLRDLIPQGLLLVCACALSLFEFLVGITLLTGSMRRTSAICATALMTVMLPLTAYIWAANPVADCGCFGDMLTISNAATFFKNIILTLLALFLLRYNRCARCLFPPWVQWMQIAAATAYCLALSIAGIAVQPLLDFRPYPVGLQLTDQPDLSETLYIYRDPSGTEKTFSPYDLPDDDSEWQFVDIQEPEAEPAAQLPIPADADSLIIITAPDITRATLYDGYIANEYADQYPLIILTGSSDAEIAQWRDLTLAQFSILQTDPKLLLTLVRGPIGIVKLQHGRIAWKRTLSSTTGLDTADRTPPLRHIFHALTLALISLLAAICLTGYLPRQLRQLASYRKKH